MQFYPSAHNRGHGLPPPSPLPSQSLLSWARKKEKETRAREGATPKGETKDEGHRMTQQRRQLDRRAPKPPPSPWGRRRRQSSWTASDPHCYVFY
jgi:hypothetical protein